MLPAFVIILTAFAFITFAVRSSTTSNHKDKKTNDFNINLESEINSDLQIKGEIQIA
jgi:hypothetical protein